MNRTEWETAQRKVCEAKQPYLSEMCATNGARLHNLRDLGTGKPLQVPYKCSVCPDWHLHRLLLAVAA
jgi:hypothetical protein